MTNFPNLARDTLLPLKMVAALLATDPSALDGPSCPYPSDIKAWLKATFSTKPPAMSEVVEAFDVMSEAVWDDTAAKSRQLYARLETLLSGNLDTSESIQIIKAQAGLLERLIIIGEKSLNHRETAEFRRIVLEVMDDVAPDQRNEIITRLEAL